VLTNKRIFGKLTSFLRTVEPRLENNTQIEEFIWKNMVPERLYKKSMILHEADQLVKKAYYVVSGFVLLYSFDNAGRKLVFRIYAGGSMVIRNSFLQGKKSPCYIWVCKDSVLKSLSYDDYKNGCLTIPGLEKLALKIANFYEPEELLRNILLSQPAIDAVRSFYLTFKALLPPGKILTDTYIASYLNITLSTLKESRKTLKEKGLINFNS